MERCRFCFVEKNKEFFKDIFNNKEANISIANIAEMLTGLTINENDEYTRLSCMNCFNMLILIHHCRETIRQTDRLLNETERSSNSNKANDNDDHRIIQKYNHDRHSIQQRSDDFNDIRVENGLRLENESNDDVDQQIIENNQWIDNDMKAAIDDIDNNIHCIDGGDKDNLQLDQNSFCNGFIIKDEIDFEEAYLKMEVNDFNDGDERMCESNHPNDNPISNNNNDNNNNDSDRDCTDIIEDESNMKKTPSIIDTDSRKEQEIQKDNNDKTINNNKNLVVNDHDYMNKKRLERTNLECQKREGLNRKCKKTFSNTSNKTDRLKKHKSTEQHLQCNNCNKRFTSKRGIKRHFLSHTGDKHHQCYICERKFLFKWNLKVHLLMHSDEKLYECNICDKKFTYEKNLKRHLLSHNDEKRHQCNICAKMFKFNANLKAHLLIHSGEKPYMCDICDKKFRSRGDLKRHLLTHTDEKSYQCDVCKKKFKSKPYLTAHLNIHTDEKIFQCHLCDKKFILKSKLVRHFLTHTREKNHQCNMCNTKFSSKTNLKRHLAIHTSEKSN